MAASNSESDSTSKENVKFDGSIDPFDVDEYLESLPRKPYNDGWPQDKWREEIEKHPFFMTEAPDPSKEMSPLIEGLQQLKYSETENTPDELAKTYKDDGNFYFKCKKYRDSISHYTAGLKLNCSKELKAQLFNNRSASNYFIQNYKSALNDCEETLKLDPSYKKSKLRKAQCLFNLERYGQCIDTCDDIISNDGTNADVIQLKKNAIQKKKLKDRNARKNEKNEQNKNAEENLVLQCIKDRNINVRLIGNKKLMKLSDLDPDPGLPASLNRVSWQNGRLFWPTILNFPELTLNIPISEFDEDNNFRLGLHIISEGMTEYDPEGKFVADNIRIFHFDKNEKLVEFYVDSTLKSILSSPRFVLTAGLLLFTVLLRDGDFTKDYLSRTGSSFLLE